VIVWMVLNVGKLLFCTEAQVVVLEEVGVHLSQVLASDLMYLAWGMLFVPVAEGRLLVTELGMFGLWWRDNDMIGSKTETVFGMLMGALVLSVRVGTKGNMMMMMMMMVAVSCVVNFFGEGRVQKLTLLLAHFSLRL
jgi:hypothetical protein